MPVFKKIIYSIQESYEIPQAPLIFKEDIPSDVSSTSSLLCSSCQKQFSEDSPEIKCEGGHVCCENCLDTAVNFAIRFNINRVACPAKNCKEFFSEKIVKKNVKGSVYDIFSSSFQPIPQATPFYYIFFLHFILFYV
jgi:hypothetical protein